MDHDRSGMNTRELASGIVSSYVANNSVRADDLPTLITSIYAALTGLGEAPPQPAAEPLVKPVSIKKSIHSDYLVSMEDGKHYQGLKRHLSGRGLTPADYRAKWGLPDDYPMAAPGYSERRSAIAKALGLGRRRSETAKVSPTRDKEPAPDGPVEAPEASLTKRGRKKTGSRA